ncbi:translocation/assembly module TamB domain-containing protein [Maribacter aestuarii]|uniref:translocation/assembly module TamB domain-containing protein n=1 Tax=Maribacter aestuarii TaxID=1130723 RepID=UPI00248CEEF0|nr:translocation/assembly module TamB domain-containing protein [Maribacter aestuarii]
MRTINKKKTLKIIGRFFLFLLLLFVAIILFIRSPWGQEIIVSKITDNISKETNTEVAIDKLFVTFTGDIQVEGLYLEDQAGDTLLYTKNLQLDLPIYPLLFKNELSIDDVVSNGLIANIKRGSNPEVFNFSFLLDVFSTSSDSTNTTEPMSISLGDFSLEDWKVNYHDAYLGIDLSTEIGNLNTSIAAFDLEEMKYHISDFRLAETHLSYVQTHAFPVTNDTTSVPLPKIEVKNFELSNIDVTYQSESDGINTNFKLGKVGLTDVLADIPNNTYKTDDFILKDSDIALHVKGIETRTAELAVNSNSPDEFRWPDFVLGATNINLENNNVVFTQNDTPLNPSQFDVNAFKIQKLALNASGFEYRPKKFNLKVAQLSFYEPSGIRLNELAFEAGLTVTSAYLSDLSLNLNQSRVDANLQVDFKSLDQAIKNPQQGELSAELKNLSLEIKDVQQLLPELASNVYLDSLATKTITGNAYAKGNLKKVDNFNANLSWGQSTQLSASGNLLNLTQTDSIRYDMNDVNLTSSQTDIKKFVSEKDLGISIPKTLTVKGSIAGSIDNISTNALLKVPEGQANVDGSVTFGESIGFKGSVNMDSVQLGKLLKNEQLGLISLQVEGNGYGASVEDLDATINGTISQFEFRGYDYTDIQIDGELVNGSGTISANIKDPNLNMNVDTKLNLGSANMNISLISNIIGADLKNLGFSDNDIKIAATIDGTYKGTPSDFTVNTTIKDGIAVAYNEQYQVEQISIRAHIEDSITDVVINSGFVNGELYSNASPNRITNALKGQLENYFSADSMATADDTINAKLQLSLRPTPIITKVFFDGFTDLDSLNVDASFDSKEKTLYAEVKVPKISYAGSSIDSLNVLLNGDATDLNFSAGLGNLTYEPIHLKKTYLEGKLRNKELLLDFNAENDSVQVAHLTSQLVFKKDTLRLHIDPEELVLNKKQWQLPNDNSIVIAESYLGLENLILSRNSQSLRISSELPKIEQEHIGIVFENFELQTFLSLFNPDEALAKGRVEGNFILLNPYGASGLISDIEIGNFQVMENPLGTLILDASSKSFSDYDFDLAIKDGDAKLKLTGDYVAKESGAELNLELDIEELKMSVIQGFFKEDISNAKGYLSGSMLVNGTLKDPTYSGRINFNDIGLTLTSFNTTLNIDNETVDLDQEKISLSNFNIADETKGSLVVNGTIFTPNLLNPGFDLNVKADRFRVLDSKKGDNELVYGIASINADVNVTGNLKSPVVNGNLRVRDITDLTYIVPQDQLEIQERDGIVIFVNKENPDAILTRNENKKRPSIFYGMDINTTLEISNDAQFTVVLDEKTQDKLQASGDAELKLNIDPNQDIRLSGRLVLNSGFYRTSLYNLVSREFQIRKGSSVVWNGDPYDAKLDVTAIYEIETSAAPLMSAISSEGNVTGSYQQAAEFMVYLNVEGQLTEPELSFALDMPESEQGNFGGAVYGRILQLNQQESELNKQVFSLLALNRFYPTTGSDGSSGGAMSLARNNVNKVLSSELNAISDKLLGNSGFELGFDLDSFEDYESGTAQSRTQLNINASKKLFNERLIVTAGSALDVEGSASSEDSATPIIGNVTLEYLLSEEGVYRLKGFRRQEYQNIIDGQLIVTGIAFIFDREFNKFSELFIPVQKENKKTKAKKSKKNTN